MTVLQYSGLSILVSLVGLRWSVALKSSHADQSIAVDHDGCDRSFPVPLQYDYGDFSGVYDGDPMNNAGKFDTHGALLGQYGPIVQMMHKLAKGGSAVIVVLGGSETAGHGCIQMVTHNHTRQGITEMDCAWPQRLKHWLLQAFPQGRVEVRNLARGGVTSAVLLAGVGMLLRANSEDPDMIILDTLVNDAFGAGNTEDGLASGFTKVPAKDGVSVAYEKLIRTIHKLRPKSTIFSFSAGCLYCRQKAQQHLKVAKHYDLPRIDWAEYAVRNPKMWDGDNRWVGHDQHPPFYCHQAIADVFGVMMTKAWKEACSSSSGRRSVGQASASASWEKTYWPQEYLDEFATCTHPLSVYDAYDKETALPIVKRDSDWKLIEDIKGKPGWISTTPNASMVFPVKFGAFPRLVVTWLRGYEKLGIANIAINDASYPLNGFWDDLKTHDKVTQSDTVWYSASLSPNGDTVRGGTMGFGVKPNSEHTVRIVNLEATKPGALSKMKIIQLLTC